MSRRSSKPKTFANTFLYNKTLMYEKRLIEAVMNGERIDKTNTTFKDNIVYDVKRRQRDKSLITILESSKTILLNLDKPLDKAFKVFISKDVKSNNQLCVFIDVSLLIEKDKDGEYRVLDIDKLISHLINAMTSMVYINSPGTYMDNYQVSKVGAQIFSDLFLYVIDYIYKISSIETSRDTCIYLASMYYLVNILGKGDELSDTNRSIARSVADISERRADVIEAGFEKCMFDNISIFLKSLSDILKLNKLNLDVLLEKWWFLYGNGTHFALELFPAFASMMTNCYVGAFLNNQKSIEKLVKDDMVIFSETIVNIGKSRI